jgi:hypothetical protein
MISLSSAAPHRRTSLIHFNAFKIATTIGGFANQ